MDDADDEHHQHIIPDYVNHAVVADADAPVVLLAFELAGTARAGLLGQRGDGRANTPRV